jgi:hypothetical protein
MFTPDDRERIRHALLARARHDERISAAAVTGSASVAREDRWSDIDLAFAVRDAQEMDAAIEDWTAHMVAEHGAVDHLDVRREPWVYRVFLLSSTLQVDLAFVPAAHFQARAPTFQLVFGSAAAPEHRKPPAAAELVGLAWLYALHVRSSIARGRSWQALYMLSCMRDQVLALACRHRGLAIAEARGVDALPPEVLAPFRDAIPASTELAELQRVFVVLKRLLEEHGAAVDAALLQRLRPVLDAIG